MTKRKPGEGQKRGETKKAILGFILNHPHGVEGTKIESYLEENFKISDKRGVKAHLSALYEDKFIYKKGGGEHGTNLWYVRYDFNVLLNLIEEYPDLKNDVLKWLIEISKEGEYQKFFLRAKKTLSLDELTELATLIEKLDGCSLSLFLLLRTEPFKDIISTLINVLDLNIIKPISDMRLSQPYIGELFVLLVYSPTAFIEFIRFMKDYESKKIDIDIITEVREIMGIHPIRVSEMADGRPVIDIDLNWFETENVSIRKSYLAITLISELNDILYRAFMTDLKEEKTPPPTIKIIRDTKNNFIALEKEKKKKRKMGKKGFRAYLKELILPTVA